VLFWWQGLVLWQQVVIAVVILYLLLITLTWFAIKFLWRKPIAPLWLYSSYSSPLLLCWPFMEIFRHPGWRRKWLLRSGLKEGQTFLEEGFGMGTSPILAARIVGNKGIVYALDNEPVHIAILWFRTRLRGLRNVRLIFSDAKITGLPDKSIDIVFVCDAFHEFGDKKGTLEEFHRILKAGGVLSMWEENEGKTEKLAMFITSTSLFTVIDRDKAFRCFKKAVTT